ncbi:MAG TPA: LamG domain-containing protein [Polyangiaceae bacterium]|nr:LamG domain-containing protein [Polyangiaceae bacterium]
MAVISVCSALVLSACSANHLQAVELDGQSLSRQLLAHWAFDDQAGSVAHDDSGNQRDGQLTGGTWLSDGQFAGALRLNDGEYVSVPRFPDVASGFTVSAWVRLTSYQQTAPNENQWTTVVSTEQLGGWEINVDHIAAEPELHFGFWKGPAQGDYVGHSCGGVSLGKWIQIAGVVDPSSAVPTFTVYLNGSPCYQATTPNRIVPGSPTLTIGQWPSGGRFLVGDVDDIAIWGRALVPAEVALLTQAPPVPPEPVQNAPYTQARLGGLRMEKHRLTNQGQ